MAGDGAGAFSPHSLASTGNFGDTMANASVADLQTLPEANAEDGAGPMSPPDSFQEPLSPFSTPTGRRPPTMPQRSPPKPK